MNTKQEIAIKIFSEESDEININYECCLYKDLETIYSCPKILFFIFRQSMCPNSVRVES